MTNDLKARIAAFLDAHHVLSLATLGADGPHAANLFYACDGMALVWLSDTDTRHSRHVAADARVAATIAPDYTDFAEIRGVQVFGAARQIVAADERRHHLGAVGGALSVSGQVEERPAQIAGSLRAGLALSAAAGAHGADRQQQGLRPQGDDRIPGAEPGAQRRVTVIDIRGRHAAKR